MGFFPYIEVHSWFPWILSIIPLMMLICMAFCFLRYREGKWIPRCCNRIGREEIAIFRRELEEVKKKLK